MMSALAADLEVAPLRWFVLHTQACQEERVIDYLERIDRAYFYPWVPIEPLRPGQRNPFLLAVIRKFEGRRKPPRKPLLPRYVLIGLNPWESLYRAEEMPGVSTLIYSSDGPLQVPPAVMAELFSRCDGDGRFILGEPTAKQNPWKVGANVVVQDERFFGAPGIVVGVDDPEKARILVEIFGRHVPITLDANKLAEAAPSRVGRVKHPFARKR